MASNQIHMRSTRTLFDFAHLIGLSVQVFAYKPDVVQPTFLQTISPHGLKNWLSLYLHKTLHTMTNVSNKTSNTQYHTGLLIYCTTSHYEEIWSSNKIRGSNCPAGSTGLNRPRTYSTPNN